MNPTQSKMSTILWWIGGVTVVVLSGLAAYLYSSRDVSQSIGTEQSTTQTSKSNSASTKDSSASVAVTSSELGSAVTDLGTTLTNIDSSLADFDAVDTQESEPSL